MNLTVAIKAMTSEPQLIKNLLTSVFQLYTVKSAEEQQKIVADNYDVGATFEDPLMHVNGVRNINTQFHSLAVLFDKVEITWPVPDGIQGALGVMTEAKGSDDIVTDSVTGANERDIWRRENIEIIRPGSSGPQSMDIKVPNTQRYWPSRKSWVSEKFMPELLNIQCYTTLTTIQAADRSLKIVKHHDTWPDHKTEVPEIAKPFTGASSSVLLRMMGV